MQTLIMQMLFLEQARGQPIWSLRATWHHVGDHCRKVSCMVEHNTQGTSTPWVNKQFNYRICL